MRLKQTLAGLGLAGLFTIGSIAATAAPAAAEPGTNTVVAIFHAPTSPGVQIECSLARTTYSGQDPYGYYWCDNLRQDNNGWAMNLWVTR
ncbi:hypothetical protein ABZX40_37310 [Streptomyces sp. NPDC004610]|uniref:hypothetical protein n=1 Tax=unclassified Streptomyces TaxID=2593676 RepID=UPI0033B0F25F